MSKNSFAIKDYTICLKKVLFISILCLISNKFKSQEIDSLWKVFHRNDLADTVRLKAIHNIAAKYRENAPDTTIKIALQELKFAESWT